MSTYEKHRNKYLAAVEKEYGGSVPPAEYLAAWNEGEAQAQGIFGLISEYLTIAHDALEAEQVDAEAFSQAIADIAAASTEWLNVGEDWDDIEITDESLAEGLNGVETGTTKITQMKRRPDGLLACVCQDPLMDILVPDESLLDGTCYKGIRSKIAEPTTYNGELVAHRVFLSAPFRVLWGRKEDSDGEDARLLRVLSR